MKYKEKQAKLRASAKLVTVYKSKLRDTWIDSSDCDTEYKPNELNFNF